MKKLLRRLILFPMFVIIVPSGYFVFWCFDGHEGAAKEMRRGFNLFWHGEYR